MSRSFASISAPESRTNPAPTDCRVTGFTPETEVLTKIGWTAVGELHRLAREGQPPPVAQYWPESAGIDFVTATVTEARYSGPLLAIQTKRKLDLLLPPEHPCLLGNRYTEATGVVAASDYRSNCHQFHAGLYGGGPIHLDPAQIAWLVAVQGDGCVRQDRAIGFGFSKQRKIDRILATMAKLGVRHTVHTPNVRCGEKARLWIGPEKNKDFLKWTFGLLGKTKSFGPWLLDLDRASLDCFVEEVLNWDGNEQRRDRYYSIDPNNAGWVQAVWSLSGNRARVVKVENANPNWQPIYHVCRSSGERAHSMTCNLIKKVVPWNGPLHGIGVPSGFVIVRRDGKVSIVGGGAPARIRAGRSGRPAAARRP